MPAVMSPPAFLSAAAPTVETVLAWCAAAAALLLAGLFATLREALEQCSPIHVLEEFDRKLGADPERRARLEAGGV